MTETAAYIRKSLQGMYPPGEIRALTRLILERVCGLSTSQILLGKDTNLSDTEKSRIEEIIQGLRSYQPIQYLIGLEEFYGMDLKVNPAVLIPRPETAELADRVIQDYREQSPFILDIGTGSGCIAIALAKHLPLAHVMAVDISEEALAVAQENAQANKVSILFEQMDILSESESCLFRGEKLPFSKKKAAFFEKELDCIVSNPPYIMEKEKASMEANVLKYEPSIAFFVPDDDPLLFYRAIARFGKRQLAEGGRLYVEINALCGEAVIRLLSTENYTDIELIQDLYGKDRIVKARS